MAVDKTRAFPPGPSSARQVLLDIQKDSLAFLCNLRDTYGNFVHYLHGPAHVFLINDPDCISSKALGQLGSKNKRYFSQSITCPTQQN